MKMLSKILPILLLLLLATIVSAGEPTDKELELWFESDSFESDYVDKSSDAQLTFIAPIVNETVPSSSTQLTITPESLLSGWIAIKQCHDNLDPVPDAEVVYRFRVMRNLRITESNQIERAWVDGPSVQLKNVGRSARLCIGAEAQALSQDQEGSYRLRYGPFQRKFLDGYFPYHIYMNVSYPEKLLSVSLIEPSPELGYDHKITQGKLIADAWFTGRLTFEYRFNRR